MFERQHQTWKKDSLTPLWAELLVSCQLPSSSNWKSCKITPSKDAVPTAWAMGKFYVQCVVGAELLDLDLTFAHAARGGAWWLVSIAKAMVETPPSCYNLKPAEILSMQLTVWASIAHDMLLLLPFIFFGIFLHVAQSTDKLYYSMCVGWQNNETLLNELALNFLSNPYYDCHQSCADYSSTQISMTTRNSSTCLALLRTIS